ncbi:hypothetical protein [Arthrobacter oryzae]|uniref:hypothetical protein n=1 Tax=Arthrobacter oryzae TaxID=409290 RepID=UPI002781063F|nr:hypothetical protein [Arthrobacter oryzae]MDQ0078659.1 hypothetical protein [Arthrobacter oryzae]
MYKRFFAIIAALAMLMFGVTTSALAATTITPAAAPTGTHLQSGTIGCSVNTATQVVSCTTFELAGVGNTNATATLITTYTATVQCRNRGGQIVEVKSQVKAAEATTGDIAPKNGRLRVPALSSSTVPTAAQFEAQATCPNGNWTKELLGGTITLSSFTYTLHFAGFTGDYITITGP